MVVPSNNELGSLTIVIAWSYPQEVSPLSWVSVWRTVQQAIKAKKKIAHTPKTIYHEPAKD